MSAGGFYLLYRRSIFYYIRSPSLQTAVIITPLCYFIKCKPSPFPFFTFYFDMHNKNVLVFVCQIYCFVYNIYIGCQTSINNKLYVFNETSLTDFCLIFYFIFYIYKFY